MPDDSNGIYNVPNGTLVNSGDTVLPSQHNPWATDSSAAISNRFSKDGRAPATGNWNLNSFRITNLAAPVANGDATTKSYVDNLTALTNSQCILSLSGGNIILSRFNGRLLTINGVNESIPAGGVSLAATGLTPSTLYYIYSYMNTGTMTLEASTTVPATDTTNGIQIKTGDATRTLVGMARPVTGPAWIDGPRQRFVLSYYNRVNKVAQGSFTTDRQTTSTTFVEINTEIRVEFLSWGDSALNFSLNGMMNTAVSAPSQYVAIGLDGVSNLLSKQGQATVAGYSIPVGLSCFSTASLGYHFATVAGRVTGSTGNWTGSGDGTCVLQSVIQG